jgi:hypothetical protein
LDLNRLSKGEQIMGGAAALLLLLSFFPFWAKYETPEAEFGGIEVPGTSTRFSAWSGAFNFISKLGLILAIILLIYIIAKAAGALSNTNLPAPESLIYLGLAGLSALLIILTAVIGPQEFGLVGGGLEISRGPLLFLGALIALAMVAGAFLHNQGGATTTAGPGRTTPPPPAT